MSCCGSIGWVGGGEAGDKWMWLQKGNTKGVLMVIELFIFTVETDT